MKKRLISAAVGLCLFTAVLFFLDSIFFNIAIGITSLLGLYELLLATKYAKNRAITAASMVYAAIFPFIRIEELKQFSKIIMIVYVFSLFVVLIKEHEKLHLEHVATVCFVTVLLSFAFCAIIYLRDDNGEYGLFYILLAFAVAWMCDAGAYFSGRIFGKRKLAPKISPNKTVEGAIGGIIANILLINLAAILFILIFKSGDRDFEINHVILTITAVVGAGISMLGDLTASIVKRHCAIKDFGTLIPGHGGVLDRFDSVIFTAPLIYLISQYFPIIN